MREKLTRILSCLLVLVMLIGLLPPNGRAYAGGLEAQGEKAGTEYRGESSGDGEETGGTNRDAADAEIFTLRFETDGGSLVEQQRIKKGESGQEPATPVKEGFAFAGWYADERLEVVFDFTEPMTGDLTVYAKWTQGEKATEGEPEGAGAAAFSASDTMDGLSSPADTADEAGIQDTDAAAIGEKGFASLQAAIDAADEGDEVRLLKNVTENVVMTDKNLTLELGGFAVSGGGSGSTLTINGGAVSVKNGSVTDALAAGKGGGIYVQGGAVVTLSGLTVANNQSVNSSDSAYGGGLCVEAGAKVSLAGCVITGNTVKGGGARRYSYGAGVYIEGGAEASLNDCTVSLNQCVTGGSYINTFGAGLCLMPGAKARLDGCTVSGNDCVTSSGRGGGLYIGAGAVAELYQCTISENHVNSKLGGAAYTEGTLFLSGGSVVDNASSDSGRPGTIYGDENAVITAENVIFHGHVKCAVYADEGGSKSVRLSGCEFRSPKNTNLAQVELNGQLEATIEGCVFKNGGLAINANAQWRNSISLQVKNCRITDNTSSDGAIVSLGVNTSASFEDCTLSNNSITGNGVSAAVLCLDDECGPVTLRGCLITGNEVKAGSTVIAKGALTLEGTIISDNLAGCVGGVQITRGGSLEMSDSVVKNNVAKGVTSYNTSDSEGCAGGVAVSSYMGQGSLVFHSGAIYDNELLTARAGEGRANDVFVQGKSPNTSGRVAVITVDIPATQMTDGDTDFSARKWKDEHGLAYEDIPAQSAEDHRYYTITEELDEYVAQVGEQQFKTVQEAIDAASDGERVFLIGDRQVISTEALRVDKALELDLCSRRLRLSSMGAATALLTVSGGGQLRLTNSEDEGYVDGGIVRGSVAVEDGGSLTVVDGMSLTPIKHDGAALVLEKPLSQLVEIALGDGRFVTLGDAWKSGVDHMRQGLKLTLSSADLAVLNAGAAADHKIIENGVDSLLRAITTEGVTNMRVRKLVKDGDIYLHQDRGVYLASSGNDAPGNGFDPAKPVRSFQRAKELLLAEPDSLDGIYIVGVVYPEAGEVWELPAGETRPVYRYKGFTSSTNHELDYMIYVRNGDFTLKNIILDGNKSQMESAVTSMIKVYSGTLYIENGAELRNNNAAKPDIPYDGQHVVHGGAVFCESVSGRIVMNGGWIHDNEAFMGGGIFVGNGYYSGDGLKFVMNGGSIENNHAVYYSELSRKFNNNANATGGGVMLAFGAYMEMNGGGICGNRADSWGGGICMGNNNDYYSLPGAYETAQQRRVSFRMNGGDISGNTASTGGGLFVQCYTQADLYAGSISGNTATDGSNQPRGGGVYVNGRHGRDGVDDGVLRIHNAVEMTGNTAEYQGNAIMTCATSLTFVRDLLGAAIHDNRTNGGVQVAFTSQSGYTQGGVPMRLHSYLSELMPGGGEYNWTTASGAPVGRDKLCDVVEPIGVTTDRTNGTPEIDTALSLVQLRINNNRTSAGGGAIGNNGSVFVGRYLTRVDVFVRKLWDDDNAVADRPDSVTIVLTRGEGADKEDYLEAVLTPDGEGKWQHTFANLQRYVIDPATGLETDEEIVYGVREKEPVSSAAADYTSTVTEDPSTERAAAPSVDPGAPTDPVKQRNFTVTNSRVARVSLVYDPNGGEGDMSAQSYSGPLRTDLKAQETQYSYDGFRFTGWNTMPDGSGKAYQPGDTIVFTQPHMVLYAQWQPAEASYRVAFYYQVDGVYPAVPDVVEERSGLVGAVVSVTAEDKTPDRDRYVLDEEQDGVYSDTLKSDGSTVLRVYFKRQYLIIHDPNGGTINGSPDEIRELYSYGEQIRIKDKPDRPGWTFLFWQGSRYDPGASYTVTGDHSFVAQWEKTPAPTPTPVPTPAPTPKPVPSPAPPATPPRTGDDSSLARWYMLAAMSLSALVTLGCVWQKRRGKGRRIP